MIVFDLPKAKQDEFLQKASYLVAAGYSGDDVIELANRMAVLYLKEIKAAQEIKKKLY